ncbi:Fms-interacting protein-domain-containing protein [Pavlovales sp. CCMP2436]|nr:Fms-interacting protein-domain-containing protein [Pavlovales sp. CCMP2436]
MRLLELRRLNRETWRTVDEQRALTTRAREAVDNSDLLLQNLQYERAHYEREIWECNSYAHDGPLVELVDEASFWGDAPAELHAEAKASATLPPGSMAGHVLQTCRLRHEQAMRAELAEQLSDVRQRCDGMREANTRKAEFLKSLLPQLEGLASASLGFQEKLQLRLTHEQEERAKAELLPKPLLLLHRRLLAVRDVLAVEVAEAAKPSGAAGGPAPMDVVDGGGAGGKGEAGARAEASVEVLVCGDVDRARLELRAKAAAELPMARGDSAADEEGEAEAGAGEGEADAEGLRKKRKKRSEHTEVSSTKGAEPPLAGVLAAHSLSLECIVRVRCEGTLAAVAQAATEAAVEAEAGETDTVEAGAGGDGALADKEAPESPRKAVTAVSAAAAVVAVAAEVARAEVVQAVHVRFSYHPAIRAVCARVSAIEPKLPGLFEQPLLALLVGEDTGAALPPSAHASGGAAGLERDELLALLAPAVPYRWLQVAAGLAAADGGALPSATSAEVAEEAGRVAVIACADALGCLTERVTTRISLLLQLAALRRAFSAKSAAQGEADELLRLATRLCAKGGGRPAHLTRWAALSAEQAAALSAARAGLVGGPLLPPLPWLLEGACYFVAEAVHAPTGARLQLVLRLHADHPRTRPSASAHWLLPPPSAAMPVLPEALLRLCSSATPSVTADGHRAAVHTRCDNHLAALELGLCERAACAQQSGALLKALEWMLNCVHSLARSEPPGTGTGERTIRGRDRRKMI